MHYEIINFKIAARATPMTLVDVLDVVLDACNIQLANFGHFLFPAAPAHYTRPPTHLIRVAKEGLALKLPILQTLKILQTMPKTSRKFQKKLCGWQCFAQPHSFGSWRAESRPLFFRTSLSMSRIICTTSQCSRMSRNALKTG